MPQTIKVRASTRRVAERRQAAWAAIWRGCRSQRRERLESVNRQWRLADVRHWL